MLAVNAFGLQKDFVMRRFAVRFAGLLLGASALSGCGMLGGDDASAVPPRPSASGVSPVASDVASAVQQAQLLRLKGDFDGATRLLSEAMLAAPDDPRVVGEYGKLLAQEGHNADAVQFLQRAIQLQPNDWTLYSALGVAYDRSNDHDNARLAYERALALRPGEAAILNNYAMSRMLVGDNVAARTLLMQAQAAGSTDPKIKANLALLDSMPDTRLAEAAPAPVKPVTAVSGNPLPPVTAKADRAPAPLGVAAGAPAVMLGQPVGPSGPMPVKKVAKAEKPEKPGKHGKAPHAVAAATPPAKTDKPVKAATAEKPAKAEKPVVKTAERPAPKPVKSAKAGKDQIPALRMAADTSKP
jgi:hypothetical protein